MNDSGLYHILTRLLDCKTQKESDTFLETVGDTYLPIAKKVLRRFSFSRTTNQNALVHKWFGQIAAHEKRTASEVKGECHRKWGLPIRLRSDQFAWVWEHSGARLNYEQQCKLLASGVLCISSGMTTKELGEYMTEIEQHYRPLGVPLAYPKEET